MKLLIDAQLPRRMVIWLKAGGCDAIHTSDLPQGNRSTDSQIIEQADHDGRVVVTKDADFVVTHVLTGRPRKLLLISLGNVSNDDLQAAIAPLVRQLSELFEHHQFVEIARDGGLILRN